jgi:hypothetical protein
MSPTEDHRKHDKPPGVIALAVALLCQLFSLLTTQLADLKRSRNRKPPPDWQAHWPALRQSEWNVLQMQAVGAKLILEGKPLDLMTLSWNWVITADFNTQPPATYREMHRRFTQATRFLADAHRLITRHAKRIAKSPLRLAATPQSTSPALRAKEENHRAFPPPALRAGGGGLRALARKTEGALRSHAHHPQSRLPISTPHYPSRHATEVALICAPQTRSSHFNPRTALHEHIHAHLPGSNRGWLGVYARPAV